MLNKPHLYFLLQILASCTNLSAQKITLESIPLNWSNFQHRTGNLTDNYTANTSSGLRYAIQPGEGLQSNTFILTSRCYIDYSNTWVNKEFISNAQFAEKAHLLSHEKGHLMISFIFHKKLQELIKAYKYGHHLKIETDSIFRSVLSIMKTVNEEYDTETGHGLYPKAQAGWEDKLLLQMNSYYTDKSFLLPSTIGLNVSSNYTKINDPLQYNYRNAQIIFEDNFDDDLNKWIAKANTLPDTTGFEKSYIAGGYMTYQNNSPESVWAQSPEIEFDFNKNFEIELSATIISSPKNHQTSGVLFWGRDTNKSAHFLYFSKKGAFEIIDCTTNNWDECKKNHGYTHRLKKDKPNTFAIRKTGQNYYLFINGIFEKQLLLDPSKGKIFGLGAGPQTTISYDYIKISYLD